MSMRWRKDSFRQITLARLQNRSGYEGHVTFRGDALRSARLEAP